MTLYFLTSRRSGAALFLSFSPLHPNAERTNSTRFSHQNVRNIAKIILYFTMTAGELQVPQKQKQARSTEKEEIEDFLTRKSRDEDDWMGAERKDFCIIEQAAFDRARRKSTYICRAHTPVPAGIYSNSIHSLEVPV